MKLLTRILEKQLIQNYLVNKDQENPVDLKPVVKFFGGAACTWLITEFDPETNCFFGLCDLGLGFPELGYVSREELEQAAFPPFGLPIERDQHWKPSKTLSQYCDLAKAQGRIIA